MLVLFVLFTCLTNRSQAAQWVEPGDEKIRHHIAVLVDSGVMQTTVASWPINWASLKAGLDTINSSQLNQQQRWSYHFLKHQLKKARAEYTFKKRAHYSNNFQPFPGFDNDAREAKVVKFDFEYLGDAVAARLSAGYTDDPYDEKEYRLDGSYISTLKGNWVLTLGAIDQWWGPGWESSAILSTYARPRPGVFIQRKSTEPSDNFLLGWMGHWQFTTFLTQLEQSRYVSGALVWGARLNFRPIPSLEIGLSRVAMWGGDDRPSDASALYNMLIGNDNQRGTADEENEPGNQLAGYDIRWNYSIKSVSGAIYTQIIGEDEAGYLPVGYFGLAGSELSFNLQGAQLRVSLEAQNTTDDFHSSSKTFNSVYNNGVYKDGYRYYERAMGSSIDNDSESVTVRTQFYFANSHSAMLSYGRYHLNKDGKGRSFTEPSPVSLNKKTLSYSLPVSEHFSLSVGYFDYSMPIIFEEQEIDSGAYMQIDSQW